MMGGLPQFLLAVVLIAAFPLASSAEEAPSGIDPSLVIDQFEVLNDGDMLLVPVKAFGKTRMFVVDTGCSLSVYDISMRRFLGPSIKSMNASTPSGAVSVELFASPRPSLGSISLHTDSPVICHDLSVINRSMCFTPIEGIVGMATLRQFVVRLDFDSGKLLFLKAVPENAGTPIQMLQRGHIPTVQVEIEGHGSEEFAIDTAGIAEDVGNLNADLVAKLEAKNLAAISETHSTFVIDASGDSKSKPAYLKGLRLGPYRLLDAEMSEQKGLNTLGLGFLSRFNLTFDFPNHQLYLQKCMHFDRPFKRSLGGIHFVRKDNEVLVKEIRENGPADKSGIKPGDVILLVGNRDAKTSRPFLLYQEFGIPETTVHVKLKRDGEIIDVDVELPKAERVTRFEVDAAAKAARTAEATEGTRR